MYTVHSIGTLTLGPWARALPMVPWAWALSPNGPGPDGPLGQALGPNSPGGVERPGPMGSYMDPFAPLSGSIGTKLKNWRAVGLTPCGYLVSGL